jgi:hypothetical protein
MRWAVCWWVHSEALPTLFFFISFVCLYTQNYPIPVNTFQWTFSQRSLEDFVMLHLHMGGHFHYLMSRVVESSGTLCPLSPVSSTLCLTFHSTHHTHTVSRICKCLQIAHYCHIFGTVCIQMFREMFSYNLLCECQIGVQCLCPRLQWMNVFVSYSIYMWGFCLSQPILCGEQWTE